MNSILSFQSLSTDYLYTRDPIYKVLPDDILQLIFSREPISTTSVLSKHFHKIMDLTRKQLDVGLHVTPEQLRVLLRRFSCVQSLKFESKASSELIAVTKEFPLITHLDISFCEIDEETFKAIIDGCPNISYLKCGKCSALSSSSFRALSQLKHLKGLDINNNPIAGEDFEFIIKELSQLEELTISGCIDIGNSYLKAVGTLTKLNSLVASYTPLDKKVLEAISSGCCSLKKLDISWCEGLSKEDDFLAITQMNQLKELNISSTQIDGKTFVKITRACPLLTYLNCSNCEFNGLYFCSIRNLTQLKTFEAALTHVSTMALALICQDCPQIEHINLMQCKEITDFTDLVSLKNLAYLDVSETDFSTRDLIEITKKAKKLIALKCSACSLLDNLSSLRCARRLKHLDISESEISGAVLIDILSTLDLKFLDCCLCHNITPEDRITLRSKGIAINSQLAFAEFTNLNHP